MRINEQVIHRANGTDTAHTIKIPEVAFSQKHQLSIELRTHNNEPPCLLLETGNEMDKPTDWQWSSDGNTWSKPRFFSQTKSGIAPHKIELPTIDVTPISEKNGMVDFGRELLGHVVFSCCKKPVLFVGESTAEALNNNLADFEQSTELLETCDGQWTSKHPLAFRYVRIAGGEAKDVRCTAQFHPARYAGAFACSDETLTRIWMNSAYTLRLCMHDFLIDGIKRDRLPWTGDMAMSIMANSYSFADADIIRRSLTVLGRAGISDTDINGIVDYSLWWIISEDFYQLYFDDNEHLVREWTRIKNCLELLNNRCDSEGLITLEPGAWLFIDWVDAEKMTALQILWWWAQISGSALAERMNESSLASKWRKQAASLKGVLYSKAWDAKASAWRAHPQKNSDISRHANLLAVISGLTTIDEASSIKKALLDTSIPDVGTPYMKGFECMALSGLGASDSAISQIRYYWGGMLKHGATTFWESYNSAEEDQDIYSFYERPFAKSLCHAWSSGPASILPATVMGIRPLADGWKRFTVEPNLYDLEWACASVPTPFGDIQVEISSDKITIHVPLGTTLEFDGRSYSGPTTVSESPDIRQLQ
ncbi:hypothetical protein JIN80_10060 [Cerasicoccus arenae]|nr:hypothetical protein [Cerasicoccus arenae]